MAYITKRLNDNAYQIDVTIDDNTQTFYHALSDGESIDDIANTIEQRLLGTYVSSIDEDEYLAKTQYIFQRSAEYPSIKDQLDLLYHGGYDAWRDTIQAVKDKYPKPE